MLLIVALSCLVASAASSIVARPILFPGPVASAASFIMARPILFPGPTACTAPSGVPGDCMLPADCPADHGPPGTRACGFHQLKLKFCCEPKPEQPRLTITTPAPSEPALPTDCGLGGPGASDVIAVANIIGHDAERSSWPWAALLGVRRSGSNDTKWICGGVLLGPRHVLTAAHCVSSSDDTLVVRLGEHDLSSESSTRQERRVSSVRRHPDFRRSLADLALLVLETPVKLSRGAIHPICLPSPDARLVDRSGYVVGWGQLGFKESQSDKLQEALVTVVKTEPCEQSYRRTREYTSRFPGGWSGSLLCAADLKENGMDACRGDSGGPLSVRRPDGRYHLAGTVLEGVGCGNPDFPGLYTSVPHYVDWIRREVERS